jgi:hypothetical protein
LESVWHMVQQGASPAEIVQAFDTLHPADVHAVLAWAAAASRGRGRIPEAARRGGRPDKAPTGGSQPHTHPGGERQVERGIDDTVE